jgi:hypothetical protein
MDTSTHNQQDASRSAYILDVVAAPDPSALLGPSAEPVIQLRALDTPGGDVLQTELFKIFMTDDAAVQVQALLRLEEGDTGLDLLFPPAAPNWGVRVENLPDTGAKFTRLEIDSRLPTGDSVSITAAEAADLADRIEAARHERNAASDEVHADGIEGQGDS